MGVRRFASHGVYGTKAGKSKQGWFHGGFKVESLSVMVCMGLKQGSPKTGIVVVCRRIQCVSVTDRSIQFSVPPAKVQHHQKCWSDVHILI